MKCLAKHKIPSVSCSEKIKIMLSHPGSKNETQNDKDQPPRGKMALMLIHISEQQELLKAPELAAVEIWGRVEAIPKNRP